MPDKLKTELDEIFNAHEVTKKQIEHQKSERELREEAFVQSFYELRDSLIRPTFESIGERVGCISASAIHQNNHHTCFNTTQAWGG